MLEHKIDIMSIKEAKKIQREKRRNTSMFVDIYNAIEDMPTNKAMVVEFNSGEGRFGVQLANRFRNRPHSFTLNINSLTSDGSKWRIIKK